MLCCGMRGEAAIEEDFAFHRAIATNAPAPWRVTTRPSARNAATASRTTVRLTPIAATISCSVGNFAPGSSLALTIWLAIRSAISRVRLRGGATGRSAGKASLGLGRSGLDTYQV